ncbi:MAG: NUDIX domain-containing protein, partial [Candidatus Methylomirabilia bacterium]
MTADLYDDALLVRVRTNLDGFARRPIARDGRRLAAVAVVVLADEQGRACFLLTRRAATLRVHAMQWAFPGGQIEEGESPQSAALRELKEEVDLVRGDESVLGLLDDYETRSGF